MATSLKKPSAPASTNGSTPIPSFNNPRLEFFYLIGLLEGVNAPNYRRLSELSVALLDGPAQEAQ